MATAADGAGLDLLGVPDHSYRPEFLEAWTTLSWIAARTERIRIVPDVANLALRPPALLARSAAALDVLSSGRVELALGTGGYVEAIASEGGARLSPGDRVSAFAEALDVVRALVTAGGTVSVDGARHRLVDARPGPLRPHPIALWVGALGPRMLRLIGRAADGWLPSITRIAPEELPASNRIIDEAARRAGRDPADIRRLYNLVEPLGNPQQWADRVSVIADRYGVSAFLQLVDDRDRLLTYAEEVVPKVRARFG